MSSLVLALQVVFPLFFLMAAGYVINILKLCDESGFSVLNKLVFKVFLPFLLFYNIYKTDIAEAINLKLIVFAIFALLAEFLFLIIFIPLVEKENRRRGAMIQGVFRSNFVLFGLPVTMSILGPENSGITSVLIAVIVPLFNVLAVICLEFFRGGKIGREKILHILKGIVTNPLIVSSVIGVLFLVLKIRIPEFIEKGINDISKMATPLALVALGGTFKFKKLSGNIFRIFIVTVLKLAVMPVVFMFIAIKLGFTGASIVALLSMLASPTAVSSYSMAVEMDSDGELAGQIVVCTTAVSIITMFAFVATLSNLGLF